ncbi:hypothetical protein EZS27_026718 [termite gut metagenome]|uniref:Uncharacterized protein n=1 Tax=termite gut metagenome TaxID=433724 RepID=A0A5J4QRH7_9ZZZZ
MMDYIDGDTYYQTNYDTHDLIRTHAQYKATAIHSKGYGTLKRTIHDFNRKLKSRIQCHSLV